MNDETTLDGAYDLELKYSLEMAAPEAGVPAKERPSAYPSLFTAFPVYGIPCLRHSLFTALKELGLRLTGKKGMAPVWVVVRAAQPGEN